MTETTDRPFWPSIRRGLRGRCPKCGEGRLFQSYLKLKPTCDACGLDLTKARTDDGPAYVTILIVSHVLVGGMLHVYMAYEPNPWVMAVGFTLGAVALSLYLLPRFKGGFVGIQWSKRMHGY